MRTCVLALAALAFAQPALAKQSHKHSHHAAHHRHRHAHHVAARARCGMRLPARGPRRRRRSRAPMRAIRRSERPVIPNSADAWNQNSANELECLVAGGRTAILVRRPAQPRLRHARAHDGALDAHDRAPRGGERPAGVAGASRGDARERLQSACAQRRRARPDADQIRDRARRRLWRLGRRPARSRDQPHLCGALSGGRVSAPPAATRTARLRITPAAIAAAQSRSGAESGWQSAPVSMPSGIARRHRYARS